ncbi:MULTISPECIES: hypothetical protein [unclassified Nitrosospira]|uniref:hypothetical protein n=1 Tax=unclassified Nitrosospira TaxID=2609267 RepID=UPI000D307A88|nr:MULTISPECIES: hypothetical protein [unclassified Nitrosospira]PTR17204.1 hypothetical protein C8R31_101363 [Nitrosospira sp. Nsp2]WON74220.1 hypothetical protein R5L00_01645 [Nitrosospira sp. Is2]
MSSTNVEFLVVNISKIEAIVEELPHIGSRREMKAKVDEILRLAELARQQAYRLADSESKETYAPNFDVLWGGRPKKDGAETPIKPPRLGKNEPTQLENIGTTERRLERVKVTWERRINPWKYNGED